MSTDTVTAPLTTLTEAEVAEIRNNLPDVHIYFDEPDTPTVLDEVHIHRDRTQDAYDASVIGAGLIGTAAAFAHAYSPYVLLNNTLIGLTVALVFTAMLLRWAVTREGRKWVYADTDEPCDPNPAPAV
ncbi:hypothetical protein [Micromonospora sp. NBC_00421]|uniref:hypothetical protein n=1 Tax=Micromonospora sp. NBC_00421 TaxID=2975976 RepID=UPI002E1B3930